MKRPVLMNTANNRARSLVRRYVEDRQSDGYAPQTLKLYRPHQEEFLNYLWMEEAIADLSRVDAGVMSRYQKRLTRKHGSASSIWHRVHFMAVKDLLGWLLRRGILSPGPAISMRFPKRENPSPEPGIQAKDLKGILDAVTAEAHTPGRLRDKAILEVLCGHPIRSGEICGLTLEDVYVEGRAIFIADEGTGSSRLLPVNAEAMRAIEKYIKEGRAEFANAQNKPWLFLTHGGLRMTQWDIAVLVRRYSRKAGCGQHVSSHRIRTALVTQLLHSKGGNS